MAYDNRGNLTQVVDSLKRRINFTYDANNNLISVSMNGKKERLKNHYDVRKINCNRKLYERKFMDNLR